jgi:DNA replication protein DnaC
MEFFISIKSSFRRSSETSEDDVLESLASPKLLVIDEVQERSESAWEDRLLTFLVNQRYNAMKDTILIANLTKAEFAQSVGASIVSRLNETGGIIECAWPSFRQGKGKP